MFDDFRFSLHVLLRRRGLSSVAILTLALGIGASAAVFSVLNGVVLLAEPLRREVAELDMQVPVFNVRAMEQAAAVGNARRTFALTLLAVFAGAAALVAAVGLYGVMAYAVVQRTREVGVRMALGAERGQVLRSFLRDGLTTALAGIGVGCVIAVFFARMLRGLVWGVELTAPMVYIATGALLIIVAFGASLLPAWRASRIPPMQALRYE
jgi:cell division protein FtsX